jgi:hypothetical protein
MSFADEVVEDEMVERKMKGKGRVVGSNRCSRRRLRDRYVRKVSYLGMPRS